MMADIPEMFHQVYVILEDRHLLCFIWQENEKEKFIEYIMNVLVFRKADFLCVCNWSLKRATLKNICLFNKKVVKTVTDMFYMEDYLDSFDSLEEAISIFDTLGLLTPVS